MHHLRHEYNGRGNLFLEEHIEKKNPIHLFEKWYQAGKGDPKTVEPNAVFLTSCTKDGYPSGRVVLLKRFGKEGFTFSPHFNSRIGNDFEENPKAALTFYWEHFSRSVRVEGDVEKASLSEGEENFRKRPYEHQIAALLSDQSQPAESRKDLQKKGSELMQQFKIGEVPKPSQWGAYLLRPHLIEFWQGQTDRLHDRIRFRIPKEGEPDNVLTKQGLQRGFQGGGKLLLEEEIIKKDPSDLFRKWYEEVKEDPRTEEPTAMYLSTCTKDGVPSGRLVLLNEFGAEGFKFFTHYISRKGQELKENPRAAITFNWIHFSREVRVEGDVEKLPDDVSDVVFSQRPYFRQIGTLSSNQSKPVASRDVLVDRERRLKKHFKEGRVPRPDFWGGYLLKPKIFEFWQGHADHLHDRIRFRFPVSNEPDGVLTKQGENGWIYERLYP
ncbi:unnamed protein product [Ceutorhynchus assimilis]|uniref:Pyridoxine-5'-phosphate oxidase n=1 Tax=Ceutorhynchus assimilis TaxID=467358 RepID=A0A9N9QJD0_9CUCU|nr:unnamed protein product [Ceutorhynchus assimilis]